MMCTTKVSIWLIDSIQKRIAIGTNKPFKDEDICSTIFDNEENYLFYAKLDIDKERLTLLEPN